MDFDTEKFIVEIQNRPAIWNTKSAEYSDKNLRSKAWEELVEIYGADLSQDKKKELGLNIQKKWRNIRDAFVKTHKARISPSGSAAKKKESYIFYDNLLFIRDTVTVNRTDGNATVNEDIGTTTRDEDNPSSNTVLASKKRKRNNEDHIGAQLVGVLSKNLEKKNLDDDNDRLFFLSLVKDFKKIPDHLRMQTKLDILRVINDAQHFSDYYANTQWSSSRPNSYRGYQTTQYSRNNPNSQPMYPSEFGRPHSQASAASPSQNLDVQSPLSTGQESQNSEHSSYLELFNSLNDNDND
ncbi:uncharacterized protein LOC124638988 [Helicoverpa zea]|nr:uncharacterized protein LOC124631100 isoform X2 [Helicoverpa zea]XP_047032127.1 uncharacterized protein LOC124638988 [Helicoverpa zea]XP_049697542.1 uncharacterized protein LOC126054818 [Helicoverpa armigera]XP_049699129.1 uncharacterized protein LOC126055164 [Helicoverpa armigera]